MLHNQEDVIVISENQEKPVSRTVIVIILLWMMLGFLAFVFSLICFAYNGTFMQNWVGFLTAIVMGPFYWIYYFNAPGYCSSVSRKQQVQRQIQKRVKQIKTKLGKKKL